jgi:hypothetical protein
MTYGESPNPNLQRTTNRRVPMGMGTGSLNREPQEPSETGHPNYFGGVAFPVLILRSRLHAYPPSFYVGIGGNSWE